ncbi:MAG: hypothetical protein AB8B57_01740 [Congregibacter sp.]
MQLRRPNSNPADHGRGYNVVNSVGSVLVALTLAVLLSACAGLHKNQSKSWPANLPPESYFASAYESDQANQKVQTVHEYLNWVRSFYQGTVLYPRGWNDISLDILTNRHSSQAPQQLEQRLFLLGRDIATEWSKDSSLSLVKSQHLAAWGVATSRAVAEQNVDETLDKITSDLQKLLLRQLRSDAITPERYHAPDPEDWFAF